MMNKLIVTALLAIVLMACSKQSTKNQKYAEIEERIAIPETKASALYDQIKPESQTYTLSNDQDFQAVCDKGTVLFVPQNSFVDASGNAVSGPIKMEVIEVLSVADFLKSNLQTTANGKILQSEGMIYIDATSNGKPVQLGEGKKIQVELPRVPTGQPTRDIQLFSGSYDTSGRINWSPISELENKLLPLPLNLFDYKSVVAYGIRILDNESYINHMDKYDSVRFYQKHLENTFIATREFEDRFWYIVRAEWIIAHHTSYDSDLANKRTHYRDSTISNIYLNNLDKPLWYCDSLTLNYLKSWEDEIEFNTWWWSEAYPGSAIDQFKQFYEQRLTNVISMPDHIDLASSGARKALAKDGFSEQEIDEILGAYKRQSEIITRRRNAEKAQQIRENSFSIAKLGWINCDRFYNNPKAKPVLITSSVKDHEAFDFVSASMIINGQSIALNGSLSEDNEFHFTGKSEPYNKLPVGDKATIVAMSYTNNSPYIGYVEFEIAENNSYEIELTETSVAEINEMLAKLN